MTREMGGRIKLARRYADMEQDDLAKEVEKSVGTISRWERGVSEPSKAEINAIAKCTKTSFFWLKEGLGPMKEEEISAAIQAIQNPDGSTINRIERAAGEAHQPDQNSPARAVMLRMVDDYVDRIRRNQELSLDDLALIVQAIRNAVE